MDIWTAVYREQEHSRSCSLDTAIHNDWTIWNVLSCKKQTHTHTHRSAEKTLCFAQYSVRIYLHRNDSSSRGVVYGRCKDKHWIYRVAETFSDFRTVSIWTARRFGHFLSWKFWNWWENTVFNLFFQKPSELSASEYGKQTLKLTVYSMFSLMVWLFFNRWRCRRWALSISTNSNWTIHNNQNKLFRV